MRALTLGRESYGAGPSQMVRSRCWVSRSLLLSGLAPFQVDISEARRKENVALEHRPISTQSRTMGESIPHCPRKLELQYP